MTKPDEILTLIAEYNCLVELHGGLAESRPPLQREGGLAKELRARLHAIYDQLARMPATTFEGLAAQVRFLGTENDDALLKEHTGIILRGLEALAK